MQEIKSVIRLYYAMRGNGGSLASQNLQGRYPDRCRTEKSPLRAAMPFVVLRIARVTRLDT